MLQIALSLQAQLVLSFSRRDSRVVVVLVAVAAVLVVAVLVPVVLVVAVVVPMVERRPVMVKGTFFLFFSFSFQPSSDDDSIS